MIETIVDGQKFTFEDGTPKNIQDRRIESWLKQNRPNSARPEPTPTPAAPSKFSQIAQAALAGTPIGLLMQNSAVKDRLTDTNFYRTLGQGVIPLADEGVAGIRSLLPQSWGGTDYDTALAAERQGVKDYADKHGEWESMGIQGLGALATIPLTMGAGAALQGTRAGLALTQLGSKIPVVSKLAANSPRLAQYLANTGIGAVSGGAAGYAAGEGEGRTTNALMGGVLGGGLGLAGTLAGKGLEAGKNIIFGGDNAVANYLRRRLPADRAEAYGVPGVIPRRPNGTIDTTGPKFADAAADELEAALAKQRANAAVPGGMGPHQPKGSDVMVGDVMPGTIEGTSLIGGEDVANLGRSVVQRQYDKTAPEALARSTSQHGLVDNWFKRLFGDANFRDTEEKLLADRARNAAAGFQVPYSQNVTSPEILDAYRRASQLHPDVIGTAKTWAQTQRGGPRQIGNFDADGNIIDLNVQHLHDIKRSLDLLAKTEPKFNTKNTFDIRNDLNEALMAANDPYKQAMKKYGEESELIDALRQGKEGVFGKTINDLDQGVGKQDIEAFLNDPNVSDAAKDMYRIGGARSAYQKLMGGDASNFSGNWAGIVNKPNLMEKFQALVHPDQAHMWTPMRDEMLQLSQRHQDAARALAGSQTAKRSVMRDELKTPSMLKDIVATLVNPSAPSAARGWAGRIADQDTYEKSTANIVAKILGKRGEAGNREGVQEIRDILKRSYGNREAWNKNINRLTRAGSYDMLGAPQRHWFGQTSDQPRPY